MSSDPSTHQDVCDKEDHLSERSNPSDTEHDISEADDDDMSLSTLLHRSRSREEQCTYESSSSSNANRECSSGFYYGKDGTMWYKTPFRRNVRTRTENIIHQLPSIDKYICVEHIVPFCADCTKDI
ncbi:unnamed protein product [Parnassius mnemosyne]|uniref:Uncharacterized protein n=1 Tax=Parnassius mnemosyne TaxID=213953 RepID=A0AAV1KM26_9NEOP